MPAAEETKIDAEKRKALNLAISQIEKQIGRGAIMRMGADRPRVKIAAISTGAINLDAATGIGGIPRGRITEIYGPESSGKTTLCLHLVANVQRAGGVAAFVDADRAGTARRGGENDRAEGRRDGGDNGKSGKRRGHAPHVLGPA